MPDQEFQNSVRVYDGTEQLSVVDANDANAAMKAIDATDLNAAAALVKTISQDDVCGAIEAIDCFHHEIHEGNAFFAAYQDSDLDTGETLDILIKVPADHEMHLAAFVSSTAQVLVQTYEAPTTTADGTAFYTRNKRRLFRADVAKGDNNTTFFVGPTVTATGTLLSSVHLGSNTASARVGSSVRESSETVLAPAVNYLVRITATNNDTEVSVGFEYYLEPPPS